MNTDRKLITAFYLCASVLIGGSILGCQQPSVSQPKAYFGPTDSMAKVVNDVNANNEQIPTLRGKGKFEAWINDQGKTNYINGDVTLLYSQPQSMRLIGIKDVLGPIFEVGSNDDRYWLIARGQQDTMWSGAYKNIDHLDTKRIPIRPDLLLEVLGIEPIPTNFLEQPSPVLRFNNDADAYMLVWSQRLTDRWAAMKEVWYDRKTKLPRNVLLFDENGRIVVRGAHLLKHVPVEVPNVPREKWPMVATYYDILFPDTGSKIKIDLSDDVALKRNGAPNASSFIFPGDKSGVSNLIDLDQQ